jgi:hypothetical protein
MGRWLALVLTGVLLAALGVTVQGSTASPAAASTSGPYAFTRPTLVYGSSGVFVREAQQRLKRVKSAGYTAAVDGKFGALTRDAVTRFQNANALPATGSLNSATWAKLLAQSDWPLLSECLRQTRAICVYKRYYKTYAVLGGKVVKIGWARPGLPATPTREGIFTVYWKHRDHVSSEFGTRMPFSMFFSGGEAFHYSDDFARNGYKYPNGTWRGSHGCVNSNSWAFSSWLYSTYPVGTLVYVV